MSRLLNAVHDRQFDFVLLYFLIRFRIPGALSVGPRNVSMLDLVVLNVSDLTFPFDSMTEDVVAMAPAGVGASGEGATGAGAGKGDVGAAMVDVASAGAVEEDVGVVVGLSAYFARVVVSMIATARIGLTAWMLVCSCTVVLL